MRGVDLLINKVSPGGLQHRRRNRSERRPEPRSRAVVSPLRSPPVADRPATIGDTARHRELESLGWKPRSAFEGRKDRAGIPREQRVEAIRITSRSSGSSTRAVRARRAPGSGLPHHRRDRRPATTLERSSRRAPPFTVGASQGYRSNTRAAVGPRRPPRRAAGGTRCGADRRHYHCSASNCTRVARSGGPRVNVRRYIRAEAAKGGITPVLVTGYAQSIAQHRALTEDDDVGPTNHTVSASWRKS